MAITEVSAAGCYTASIQKRSSNMNKQASGATTVMSAFWPFLRDKHNQQVLGWLGGGLVALATALWVVVVAFFPALNSSEPQSSEPMPPTVQADCGGVAVGGNVSGSTITTGGATTSSDCVSKPK
jgi:hypothetical protein